MLFIVSKVRTASLGNLICCYQTNSQLPMFGYAQQNKKGRRTALETSSKNAGIEIRKQIPAQQTSSKFGKSARAVLSNGFETGLLKLGISLGACIIVAAALLHTSKAGT